MILNAKPRGYLAASSAGAAAGVSAAGVVAAGSAAFFSAQPIMPTVNVNPNSNKAKLFIPMNSCL